jgi:hypothetical protein
MMGLRKLKLRDMNLLALGNIIQVSGVIYADADTMYVCMLPDEPAEDREMVILDLSQEDWEAVLRQTDIMETELITCSKDGTVTKAIIRKSTRQIEQGVSWKVYRRDGFRCRYCGKDDVPLTVDHLVCWEHGGPSIVENLVASCRKCNKTRGQLRYSEWLRDPHYLKVSRNLDPKTRELNEALLPTLPNIPLRVHEKAR